MCMILSPNCCAVTVFEYSSTDVTLLPSCLSILSVHSALQCKWQSANLELLKLMKKRKTVWPVLFLGSLIKFLTSVLLFLGQQCTARLKVNQNTRSPQLSEDLNLEKEWPFLFWVVKLLYCSVNNLGLKFVL